MSDDATIIKDFSDLYFLRSAPWMQVHWRGAHVIKCPFDLWAYSELIFETKPDVLIETGTHYGGSALFFADCFDLLGRGHVYTVEREAALVASASSWAHPRVTYLMGDSTSDDMVAQLGAVAAGHRTMVSLDSEHTYEQVSAELARYHGFVSPGCYLVVEDTNLDAPWGKPAGHAAVMEFVAAHPEFTIDKARERHLLTFNPDGWLLRTA